MGTIVSVYGHEDFHLSSGKSFMGLITGGTYFFIFDQRASKQSEAAIEQCNFFFKKNGQISLLSLRKKSGVRHIHSNLEIISLLSVRGGIKVNKQTNQNKKNSSGFDYFIVCGLKGKYSVRDSVKCMAVRWHENSSHKVAKVLLCIV